MKDRFGREIDYIRVSVTDRCNFRCIYCMPEGGVVPKTCADILRFEEIARFLKAIVPLGISTVRITGGEPLVRRGIVDFVRMVRRIPGVKDIAMTTNGSLLAGIAADLKRAGLDRVNISLDSLKPERFRRMTRNGDLKSVLNGIDAALENGLEPVKINCVVIKGFNDDEIMDFADLTRERNLTVRFIELMPIGESEKARMDFVPADRMSRVIGGELEPVEYPGEGAGPAVYYRLPGAKGYIGFIAPMTGHFCSQCNRVRLTSDGKLKVCLDSEEEFDVKAALRGGACDEELRRIFTGALMKKPEGHRMNVVRFGKPGRTMCQIGG
ncbi:GTP 3',8-cyclase MoaA [Thermosediminibacter litoriperuensis]|uniref:GTP 3',8-cyclase n=1 Tax=Thermosediminibacter litoriperuensis TaxID=291989 RepID=A0A5S5AQD4_9FIRM|nr:GTP 3',8-cyclase MoaA [Thermosediminibacter litoriperuensis]TYP54240.1 cyclic pyranopterin monophosphate synthase subunit MoaA [Thermosediminibacter litoriperuensis]